MSSVGNIVIVIVLVFVFVIVIVFVFVFVIVFFLSHAEYAEYAELPVLESLVHAGAGIRRMALVSLCLPGGVFR